MDRLYFKVHSQCLQVDVKYVATLVDTVVIDGHVLYVLLDENGATWYEYPEKCKLINQSIINILKRIQEEDAKK